MELEIFVTKKVIAPVTSYETLPPFHGKLWIKLNLSSQLFTQLIDPYKYWKLNDLISFITTQPHIFETIFIFGQNLRNFILFYFISWHTTICILSEYFHSDFSLSFNRVPELCIPFSIFFYRNPIHIYVYLIIFQPSNNTVWSGISYQF